MRSAGFTLIELMVVLAIIVAITAVVFTSQSSFNKTLILANTAYDIALTIRSAETYGLGGRAISTLPLGYGIHVDRAIPRSFVLFADTYPAPSIASVCHATTDATTLDAQPGDCAYQPNQDVAVSNYVLGNSALISDFCASVSGNWSCAVSHGGGLATLDIVFARPNPDALMSMNGVYSSVSPVTDACLTISSPQGGFRFVSVSSSGRITADAVSCPW